MVDASTIDRREVEDELARQKLARVAAESSGEYLSHNEVKRRLHRL